MARYDMAKITLEKSFPIIDIAARRNRKESEASEVAFRASVVLSAAMIVQTARDLIADCDIIPGMTEYQIEARRQNSADRETARKWTVYPQRGDVSLSDCLSNINQALSLADLAEIPLHEMQQTLLNAPERIVDLYPGAANRKKSKDNLMANFKDKRIALVA